MARWLIFCSFIFCLSMTLLGLILDLTYQLHYKPLVSDWQSKISQISDGFQIEKDHFDKHPFFSKQPKEGTDFADYLRERITEEKAYVLVNRETQKSVLSLGVRWLEKRHLIKPSELIEEVFQKVQAYSKWSVYKTLRLNSKLESTEFIVSGQILAANAVHSSPENLIDTLVKIRHMAFLLLASENFNFKLAGLSLLEKEAHILDYIKDRRLKMNGEWHLIPAQELKRYRKFLKLTYNLYGYLTPTNILKKHFLDTSLPIGFCSIYFEKQHFIDWMEPFLNSQFPFEPSYTESLSVLEKIQHRAQESCYSESDNKNSEVPFITKIPYYRRIIGLQYLLNTRNLGAGS